MTGWRSAAIVLTVLAAVCAGFLYAQAQQQAPPQRGGQPGLDQMMDRQIDMMFRDMDTNHDGKISKKEWMDFQAKQFDRIDRNHYGFITKDDVRADMRNMRDAQARQQARMQQRERPPAEEY